MERDRNRPAAKEDKVDNAINTNTRNHPSPCLAVRYLLS